MTGPYKGLRVVDLAEQVAGSYAAMLLAELGADVVKVEPPSGNVLRGQAVFHALNRSKRSVVVDPTTVDGYQSLRELLDKADILIAEYTRREERALRLEYELLATTNPRLIYCAMPPMGGLGPLANTCPHDALVTAHSGLMAMQSATREGPVFWILPAASYGAGLLASAAIGAALHQRTRTLAGQRVEVSWLAGALAISRYHLTTAEGEQESFWDNDPQGGKSPAFRNYQCSDGKWLCLSCAHATFYARFCLAIDMPEILSDPRFEHGPWNIEREHRATLKETFTRLFKTRTQDEWIRLLRQWDVPCLAILGREEAIVQPQVIHCRLPVEVRDPELGPTIQIAPPIKMSLTPPAIQGPAPQLGEHTGAIWPVTREGKGTANITNPITTSPLAGLRVLDLGSFIAGGMIGCLLAEMGAEVIKVESPEGDHLRSVIYAFTAVNRGKRSIVLDLTREDEREALYTMVKHSDVLVENYRPGVSRHLRLDYETLRQINPRLVVYSGTSWGTDGPSAMLPGLDNTAAALTGLMRAQGGQGHPPVYNSITVFDHATALCGTAAVLAAIYHREQTGLGQHVEVSMLAVSMAIQATNFISYEGKPRDPDGGPDLLGVRALERLYKAADGWLVIVAATEDHWLKLCAAVAHPELHNSYAPMQALTESRDGKLAGELEAIFATQSRDAWLSILSEHDVPATAALTLSEMYRDPQIVANNLFLLERYEPWGNLWLASNLAKFPNSQGKPIRPAPGKDQHGDEILRELGFGRAQIEAFKQRRS